MRCSSGTCGFVGPGRFCQECGSKMVEEHSLDTVIICSGKLADGSPCNAELVPSKKFCSSCGLKVDLALFASIKETCSKCGAVVENGAPFCSECGMKQNKSTSDTGKGNSTEKEKKQIQSTEVAMEAEIGVSVNTVSAERPQEQKEGNDNDHQASTASFESEKKPNYAPSQREDKPSSDLFEKSTDIQPVTTEKSTDTRFRSGGGNVNKGTKSDDSDVEMLDGSSMEEKVDNQRDIPKPVGNLSIFPARESSDLSKEFEQVRIENDKQGNLKIFDEKSSNNDGKDKSQDTQGSVVEILVTYETTESEADSEYDSAEEGQRDDQNSSLEVTELPSPGNGQTKRSKKQKKDRRKRKRKKERSTQNTASSTDISFEATAPKVAETIKDGKNLSGDKIKENENDKTIIDKKQKQISVEMEERSNSKMETASKIDSMTKEKLFGAGAKWGILETGGQTAVVSPHGHSLFDFGNSDGSVRMSTISTSTDVSQTEKGNDKDSITIKIVDDEDSDEMEKMDEGEEDNGDKSHMNTQALQRSRRQKKNQNKKDKTDKPDKDKKENKNKNEIKKSVGKEPEKTPATTFASGSGKKGQQPKETLVHFHVLVSGDFKFQAGKHQLILRTNVNWEDMSHVCREARKLADGTSEMEIQLSIPTTQIASGKLLYKYCLYKGEKGKYLWEHYMKNDQFAECNRRLILPEKWKNSDVWHQYDGFVEKEPTGWKEKLFNFFLVDWKNHLTKHAKQSVHHFALEILQAEETKYSLTFIMDQLEALLSCTRRIYYTDAKCWDDKEANFKEEIGTCLLEVLTSTLNEAPKLQTGWDDTRERQVTMAVAVVYSAGRLDLAFHESKKCQNVCEILLLRPDREKKQCSELTVIDKYFKEKRKELTDAFSTVAGNIARKSRNPCWMYLIPWIHVLHGWCKPYDTPEFDVGHDSVDPRWWGLTKSLNDDIQYFKGKSEWDKPKEEVLEWLDASFEVDFLLQRTFLAAVDLKFLGSVIQSERIPVEVSLAGLIYFIKKTRPKYLPYFRFGQVTSDENTVMEAIRSLAETIPSVSKRLPENVHQRRMQCYFASQLLVESTKTDRNLTFVHCVETLLLCLSKSDGEDAAKLKEYATEILRKCMNEVLQWMDMNMYSWDTYTNMDAALWHWNRLYAPSSSSSGEISEQWNKTLTESLEVKLQRKVCDSYSSVMTHFVQIYCNKSSQFCVPMQNCLSKTAFKAIEKGYAVNYERFNHHEIKVFGELLSDLFLREWNKHVKDEEQDSILMHVLKWPPIAHYMKIYSLHQEKMKLLSDNCANRLVFGVSVIQSCVAALLDGDITIGNLHLIQMNIVNFPELAELVKLKVEHSSDFIKKAIQVRQREVDAFGRQAELMTNFTSLCQHLGKEVDRGHIDSVLKKQEDIEKHKVKEFCAPSDVSKIDNIDTFLPKLNAFKVSQQLLDMLPELKTCSTSSVFMFFWVNECHSRQGEVTNVEDVVSTVWLPARKRWDIVVQTINTGEIKYVDFEKVLGNRYKEEYNQMEAELKNLRLSEKIIRKRIDQIKKIRQLNTCAKGAAVILKFAMDYKLKGNFDQIRMIASNAENDIELKSFDESVMNACDFLKDLTQHRAKCLSAFVQCRPLVQWLKESMEKSGLKELKVFVDLAFMSAGDEPMNIKRVQCLHTAVTGYAPLIFELNRKSGYKDLLRDCELVWKELETNPNLPQMLIDTNRHLEWLKDIKKAHGSVEVTSLMQVEAINAAGVYTIGKNAWKKDAHRNVTDGSLLMVADIVQLTVPEREGKRQLRNYTFSELQDLQSRLMLVAGKAEKSTDSVDRFTMIFDSVTRLSNVYLKLSSAGCVLFKDFTARFLCDPSTSRPVCIILNFGLGEQAPQLKGRRSANEDLKDMIPELAKFMETCYEDWLQHIREKRKTYLHLNYFTVDQLVILQRELVKMGTEEEPSHLIYPLLSAVNENCTPDDLLEAMTAAKEEIEGEAIMENATKGASDEGISEVTENIALDEQRQNFVKELVETGYDEHLATRALEFVNPDDVTQGIVWCMENEDTEMLEDIEETSVTGSESFHEPTVHRPAFTGWSHSQTDIQTMIKANISGLRQQNDVGSQPLLNELSALWTGFLESITSNIRDFLSLEHLGIILKHLAQRDTRDVTRSLPPGFKEGQPNLIICPSAEVLLTTLSIYKMDKDQQLPQSDEVLLCTPNTTKDEVDIFWRRAIFDGRRKIHSLVNAELLDYDVSEAAERCLEDYLLDVNYKDLKYRLLVICGSDNEYKSGLVSSLDKFKCQALPVNVAHLREYLLNKLTVQQQTVAGIKPAASVDRERSSVRVIKSWRAGVGKTLYKVRREDDLSRLNKDVPYKTLSIPLQEKNIDLHYVISRLLENTLQPGKKAARIFHIDVSHEVQNGVDYLLFNLVVLGFLVDKTGFVWRKSLADLYLVETVPLMMQASNRKIGDLQYVHPLLGVLPDLTCRSPQESMDIYQGYRPRDFKESDQLFDDKQFRSPSFQRTFQYLFRLDRSRQLDDVNPNHTEGTPQACLQTLLRHCGLEDPSWSELHHFVWFLNTQLVDFELNSFVSVAAAEDLPGFTKFVLRFLITMSKDFSTRSLNMSEESPGLKPEHREVRRDAGDMEVDEEADNGNDLQAYQMRRTWESSPHPYLFFNCDRFTFTFLGFFIDRTSGNLIDTQTGAVLEKDIMVQNLYDSLVRNHAPMQENFDALPRDQKIMKLCNMMGIEFPHDPDDTYELTTDNVKKILAIYMRFRCDIPVIIMGETGCGKTRLVKFMCALQSPPGVKMTNMILMKVHGGTTNKDIIRKVREAENIAKENRDKFGRNMYTVLFFDEANTTESIGLIKEIMCDKSMEGQKLKVCENLKMVAAVNPYRKHSEELIKKLEQAGLGYHVDADETTDRLGRVPMRRLVYRVQPLPQSLLPLVWDFGQLNTQVEDLYIRQMVRRYIREDKLPDIPNLKETVSAILTASQEYMRAQMDECSFVSLRDVDRVLTVMSWFYQQSQGQRTLFDLMDRKLLDEDDEYMTEEEEEDEDYEEESMERYRPAREHHMDDITRSLILALGVCYHACLKTRPEYRAHAARYFSQPCMLPGGAEQIREEIECCQEVFLDHVHLEKNIARNMALKENVFMMVVCIELRIPLFLVGKPGSSKSLAKTIVSDAMQGNTAREELFRQLKQAQMVSFQCSPLSTPDGIVGTFRQCAQFQKDKDLDTFVSIVVLDEVGLAEDSPRMPLKTLHPLLEDGCQGDEKPEKYKKVAFIGISNWALDPAKMNRGILVQREVPDLEELKNSASGICQTDDKLESLIAPLIEPMAESYLEVFNKASKKMREFYGLRDFYSLVKMVYGFVEKSKQTPTWHEMLHAIKRNFGGLDQVNPEESFRKHLSIIVHLDGKRQPDDPDNSPSGLIQACLFDSKNESRYLLLLTENYGALSIIQQQILSRSNDIHPITIFGSSFRSDQEYTQVCRNINKIKVCMETGKTVVLLNLENLYESLYDALNQYYVYFGGERYVDLGLGTHRVKCPVHKNFRLIVVAEKQTVYKKFPIPLINRLEKHFLSINTMLSEEQQNTVKKLEQWAQQFVAYRQNDFMHRKEKKPEIGEVFIGYHDDTCSAIVLDVWGNNQQDDENRDAKIFEEAKLALLWCATPESLVRLEQNSFSPEEKRWLNHQYYRQQQHESLIQYLQHFIGRQEMKPLLSQVTTHSKLLAGVHRKDLSQATGIPADRILLLETLSSFDTEQQFTNRIQQHIQSMGKDPSLMVIQCDSGDVNANLIACARYCVRDEFEKMSEETRVPIHVVFIVQLPRGARYTGFQCGLWHSVHIDDLYTEDMNMPTLHDMQGKSVAQIFNDAVSEPAGMDVDQELHRDIAQSGEQMEWTEQAEVEKRQGHFGVSAVGSDTLESDVEMRTEPLQLHEVLRDLQTVNQSSKLGQYVSLQSRGMYTRLNVKGLILNCVQAALSMVKEKEENTGRETQRVSLVLKLLHQETSEGQAPFLHGVCCLIAKLLKQKESRAYTGNLAQHWLLNEAASNENINKAGTFRRSCLQTLEGKVSPILAGIIAYLDTNNNLSILDDTRLPWKQELWLAFLNTTEALSLEFADLQSPTRQTELLEAFVMSTGCEGQLFAARMPFSWLIHSQITEILRLPYPNNELNDLDDKEEVEEGRMKSTVRILSEHPIGCVLGILTVEQIVEEAVMEYIHDFVYTMYKALSDEELQLVVQSVTYFSAYMRHETTNLLERLVYVHIAFETLAPRLAYFREMNSVWPECCSTIIQLKKEKPDHYMFQEKEFAFSALCLLIENLTPKATDLNDSKGRSRWLGNVHRYRPVVEKVISLPDEDPKLYGAHSMVSVKRARRLWSRVMVVKLFLEHVCTTERRENKITIKHCMPLWGILTEETDLKEMKSFSGVEMFLKTCNKQAIKEYLGSEEKCCNCESVLEGPPITLPCKDVLCDRCYNDQIAAGDNTCTKCHKSFPDDWEPVRQRSNRSATEKFKDYQTRCNTFFMDVVSQLCFAENSAPSPEVINTLLGYIFLTTKGKQQLTRELSVFDTGIDPNPVFRSFLLQLLMRTSEASVMENLSNYLKQAEGLIKRDDVNRTRHFVELSLLVIQCLEDLFTQEVNRSDADELQYTTQALRTAKQSIEVDILNVEKLYGLANARMGLAVVAKHIADIVRNNVDPKEVNRNVRKLIEAAQTLCEDTTVKWNRIYLVKFICRYYGIDVYQNVCRDPAPFLRWVSFKDMNRDQVVEVSDRYIVCGEDYTVLREAVTKVVLGEDMQHLAETVQELQTRGAKVETMLQLAIHREVTFSNVYPQQRRKVTLQFLQNLDQFITTCDAVQNKAFLQALTRNRLMSQNLVVLENSDLRHQGVQCLILHLMCMMSVIKGDRTLLHPLLALMGHPQTCANMFLPTMPQDDLEDIKEALLAARANNGGENPVFYRCPNGHPYVIGNCGRPASIGNCRDCGAAIGGEGYQLRPGNILDQGRDTTVTGHILGRADARGQGPKPERELTPSYCATVRLLVHLSMYIGAITNVQGVQSIIRPDVDLNEVEDYLWAHIQKDISDIQKALGRSVDDILLLMHAVLHYIMTRHNEGEQVGAEVHQLSTKRGRQQWEGQFSAKFLQPCIQDLDNLLKTNNQRIAQDQRLGADPLLCLLYETETPTEEGNLAQLQEIPRVWRYRTPITLSHLRQEAMSHMTERHYKVLHLFLREEHHLRALRYIPSILRLHRALFQKYQRRLDKAEASQITVAHLRKDEVAGAETHQLLSDFTEAWELDGDSLKLYLCPTEVGGMIVSKEYCNTSITDKTPVSMLLPTTKEAGLCSYALLDFLMRKQNDFLDKYLKETRRKQASIPTVQPREVTTAHLISYDTQHDILPLILANCQYSFEMGKGTKIEYDFAGLERQLMDRFLFSKSRIDVGRVLQIDMMVYRTEFTNAEVFRKLANKIPQEALSTVVKTQISSEFRSLPDLCQSLDNLDITISFLKSTGGPPDRRLHSFMLETLKMGSSIHSQKAQQACEFQHAQSLWLLLSLLKSKKMTDNRQHSQAIFESLPAQFHEEIPPDIHTDFKEYAMRKLSVEKLSQLIEVLHEYILLVVAVRQSPDDEDFTDTTGKRLGEWLLGYIEGLDNTPLETEILSDFPKDILYKHSIHTWIWAYIYLREKMTGQTRRY